MQSIQLSDAQFEKIAQQAAAAGFVDVAAYVATLIEDAAFDPRCGMTDDELRQSAAECNAINERMKSGGGLDARQAFTALGKKYGFDTPE
jgi:hypothetical protein